MGIKLNAFGVSNNDKTKPNTRHQYFPDISFPTPKGQLRNRDIPKKDRVVVTCDFLTVGNRDDYLAINQNGSSRIDFTAMFAGQVSEIHNLDHPTEDREITIEELLNVYGGEGSTVAHNLIVDVSLHIYKGSALEEEEQKN
jgi:hypothetical protein